MAARIVFSLPLSGVYDQVPEHLPRPVYLLLLRLVSFQSLPAVSNLVQGRPIPLLILNLPDSSLRRAASFIFLPDHQLNRFVTHAGFFQVRNLFRRQAEPLPRQGSAYHKNHDGYCSGQFNAAEAQILLDKRPNQLI